MLNSNSLGSQDGNRLCTNVCMLPMKNTLNQNRECHVLNIDHSMTYGNINTLHLYCEVFYTNLTVNIFGEELIFLF